MIVDECGLCDARRDDVREYDADSGLYLCRPCRDTEDEYRRLAHELYQRITFAKDES